MKKFICSKCKKEKDSIELDIWYGNGGKYLYSECLDKNSCNILLNQIKQEEYIKSWSYKVDKLIERGKVKIRSTDHEFRDDARNIIWIYGIGNIDNEISVESLNYPKENNLENLCLYLLKLYNYFS